MCAVPKLSHGGQLAIDWQAAEPAIQSMVDRPPHDFASEKRSG